MSNLPFYRVAHAFLETYHMRGNKIIYHMIVCLSCMHWKRIQNKHTTLEVIGRLFSCAECSKKSNGVDQI